MYWLTVTVSAETAYLLSRKTYTHRKIFLRIQIRILEYGIVLVISNQIVYAASHHVERWKLVVGNVLVHNNCVCSNHILLSKKLRVHRPATFFVGVYIP